MAKKARNRLEGTLTSGEFINDDRKLPPELQEVIDAWKTLPETTRQSILALVKAAAKE
jgi:hypothetical protein